MSASGAVVTSVAVGFVQVLVIGIGGLLLVGLMRKVRSHLEGRVGPPIHQPMLDLRKLFTKERVRPDHASWIFPAGPVVLVATVVLLAAISPLLTIHPPIKHGADFFVVVFVLLIGSVVLALAALDPGTPFGGMGASRAMTIAALTEPALLVAILALSIPARTSDLSSLVRIGLIHPQLIASPGRILALGAFVVVILAESGRLPIDNPSTHLELTMIHEAMVLEYAGSDLALVTLGEAMRLSFLVALLVNLFAPWGVATRPGAPALVIGLVALAGKVALAGMAIATFEVFTAKLRLFRVPELLAGGFVLAVFASLTALVVR